MFMLYIGFHHIASEAMSDRFGTHFTFAATVYISRNGVSSLLHTKLILLHCQLYQMSLLLNHPANRLTVLSSATLFFLIRRIFRGRL